MSRGRPPRYQPQQQQQSQEPTVQPSDVHAMLQRLDGGSDVIEGMETPPAIEQVLADVTHPTDPLASHMDDAPHNETRVWLIDGVSDHPPVLAYWRKTRQFRKGCWQEISRWYRWRGSEPLGFEPVGWYEAV